MKLPHLDDWELSPENAHPVCRQLLSEHWYWDAIEEWSPFGNDTGADTLFFYSQRVHETPGLRGIEFVDHLLEGWQMNPHWEAETDGDVRAVLESEPYGIQTGNDAAVATAFGQVLLFGAVEDDVRRLALRAIQRSRLPALLALGGFPEVRIEHLGIMSRDLQRAPSR